MSGNRRVLVISPTPTHPANAGNRVRIAAILRSLDALGFDFHFAYFRTEQSDDDAMRACWGPQQCTIWEHQAAPDRTPFLGRVRRRLCRMFSIPYYGTLRIDALKSAQLEHQALKLAAEFKPDAVVVEYVFYSWLLELFGPEVLKIIDTHDVFTNRHQRFLRNGVEPEWYSTTRRQERKGLQRANCVIAIQEREREFFSKLTEGKVVTVGHIAPTQDFSAKESAEPRVLLTASHNQVNRDGADHFIKEVWPLIRRLVPGAQLELSGRICNDMAPAAGVVLSGELPSLEPAYARAWVVVSPLRFGTGLKIKTIEAMAFGKATVATAVSAEGLESAAGTALRVADEPESFAAECVSLLESTEMRRQLGRRALAFVEGWNVKQRQSLAETLG